MSEQRTAPSFAGAFIFGIVLTWAIAKRRRDLPWRMT